jgi:hypothetical protein
LSAANVFKSIETKPQVQAGRPSLLGQRARDDNDRTVTAHPADECANEPAIHSHGIRLRRAPCDLGADHRYALTDCRKFVQCNFAGQPAPHIEIRNILMRIYVGIVGACGARSSPATTVRPTPGAAT